MTKLTEAGVLVLRGAEVESRHEVHAALCEASGRVRRSVGDPAVRVFLRSAAKPFQAAAVVASGALDRLGVGSEELAIIAASHAGEDRHVEVVTRLLGRMGLEESALRCGAHPPFHRETAQRVGAGARPVHHNCSGKHAGMLALAIHLGVPVVSYLDPDGPVQKTILDAIMSLCGIGREDVAVATDGCSAPTFAVPLRAGARAFALLAHPDLARADLREALRRVADAMTAHPGLVGGTGRFDTRLMEAAGGRLCSKGGAEAVQGFADRESGLGLLVKIADGGVRAIAPAAIEALRQVGWLPTATIQALEDLHRPVLANHAGLEIGRIEPRFVLETPARKAEGGRHGR